jgi:hypothetical protein
MPIQLLHCTDEANANETCVNAKEPTYLNLNLDRADVDVDL